MNVYPRKPLEATRYDDDPDKPWGVRFGRPAFTDAEFAEHFYPAELLDALIAAVDVAVRSFVALPTEWDTDDAALWATDFEAIIAAFRAFREQVTA